VRWRGQCGEMLGNARGKVDTGYAAGKRCGLNAVKVGAGTALALSCEHPCACYSELNTYAFVVPPRAGIRTLPTAALLLLLPRSERTFNHLSSTQLPPTHQPSTMKYATVCAAFFAAVAAASDVKQLKTDNFKSFIEENDLVLAECKSPCEFFLQIKSSKTNNS
jgi:hypothetical protein